MPNERTLLSSYGLIRQIFFIGFFNPNTFVGLVGKVRKKLSPEGGRKGGWRKKAGPGLEPGTCRVLGEGPGLHARGAV